MGDSLPLALVCLAPTRRHDVPAASAPDVTRRDELSKPPSKHEFITKRLLAVALGRARGSAKLCDEGSGLGQTPPHAVPFAK